MSQIEKNCRFQHKEYTSTFVFWNGDHQQEKKYPYLSPLFVQKSDLGPILTRKFEQPSALPTFTCDKPSVLFPSLECVPHIDFPYVRISVNVVVRGKGMKIVTDIVHVMYMGIVIQNIVHILVG